MNVYNAKIIILEQVIPLNKNISSGIRKNVKWSNPCSGRRSGLYYASWTIYTFMRSPSECSGHFYFLLWMIVFVPKDRFPPGGPVSARVSAEWNCPRRNVNTQTEWITICHHHKRIFYIVFYLLQTWTHTNHHPFLW